MSILTNTNLRKQIRQKETSMSEEMSLLEVISYLLEMREAEILLEQRTGFKNPFRCSLKGSSNCFLNFAIFFRLEEELKSHSD